MTRNYRDIYIKTTEEDFLDGRDPVLDFIFEHNKKGSK